MVMFAIGKCLRIKLFDNEQLHEYTHYYYTCTLIITTSSSLLRYESADPPVSPGENQIDEPVPELPTENKLPILDESESDNSSSKSELISMPEHIDRSAMMLFLQAISY